MEEEIQFLITRFHRESPMEEEILDVLYLYGDQGNIKPKCSIFC
jgi:hypothetical protein